MFNLKIKEAVGGRGGQGKAPSPLLNSDLRTPAVYKFFSLPSLPLSLKSKEATIIFAQEILSTRQNYACSTGYEKSCQNLLIVTRA